MKLSEMHTPVTPRKINKVMESRFGFTIDYDNLTYAKAQRLHKALRENMQQIKRSFGAHTAEKNPKYMELMMVSEGLDRWLNSEQGLFESEMGASEARLAAQDVVDSIQDMVEKISKIQNEQMPALIATIRDQIGTDQSEQFKGAVSPVLASIYQALTQGRDGADSAVLALAGENVAQPMSMPGADAGMGDGGMPDAGGMSEPDLGSDLDADAGDGFDATEPAAGGSETLGRGRR